MKSSSTSLTTLYSIYFFLSAGKGDLDSLRDPHTYVIDLRSLRVRANQSSLSFKRLVDAIRSLSYTLKKTSLREVLRASKCRKPSLLNMRAAKRGN